MWWERMNILVQVTESYFVASFAAISPWSPCEHFAGWTWWLRGVCWTVPSLVQGLCSCSVCTTLGTSREPCRCRNLEATCWGYHWRLHRSLDQGTCLSPMMSGKIANVTYTQGSVTNGSTFVVVGKQPSFPSYMHRCLPYHACCAIVRVGNVKRWWWWLTYLHTLLNSEQIKNSKGLKIIMIIIIRLGDTVTMSHYTKCNKLRASSTNYLHNYLHTLTCRWLATWQTLPFHFS